MWEEINEKQNQDKMLELQFYSRKLYNRANILFLVKIIVLIINAILAVININAILVVILSTASAILHCLEKICIKNAASAREIFDAILFGFDIPKEYEKIRENAYKICSKHDKEFKKQKSNTGEDKPAGVKNWYTENSGKTRNEIIFNCQVENTKWDEEITKINSIIFWSIISILFLIYIILRYKDSVIDFILGIILSFELVIQIISIFLEYRKYNKNLIERKKKKKKMKSKRITRKELISLQELIKERRNLKLVPFNSIHKYITIKMHDLIRNK